MSPNKSYELVSFILLSYNSSKYIREAILGAISQDYDNLEVIISDDCSTDDTWQIIQDVIENTDTRHKVILNRNGINQGIGKNLDKAVSLSNGKWKVVAAGDDISLPNRVTKLVHIVGSDSKIRAAYSQCVLVDSNGFSINQYSNKNEEVILTKELNNVSDATKIPTVSGCVAMWHEDLFKLFAPLGEIVTEDAILSMRINLLGMKSIYTDDILVKYRVHDLSLTNAKNKDNYDYLDKCSNLFKSSYVRIQLDILEMMNRDDRFLSFETLLNLQRTMNYDFLRILHLKYQYTNVFIQHLKLVYYTFMAFNIKEAFKILIKCTRIYKLIKK